MKRYLSVILLLVLTVSAYTPSCTFAEENKVPGFKSHSDARLLDYVEDTLYEGLVSTLDSEEYFVENVSAIYISQEYIDELAYNSQANVFFGYTMKELDEQFKGQKYIFTLGENNKTVVEPWTAYDDTYERVIKNVAVGTGVILICVTVSVVSAGVGAPAVSMVFAVAAKSATASALSGAVIGGVSAGIVTGMQTGNMDEAMKSAALAGSESFKWGAISGAISGGADEAIALKGATINGLTLNQAAAIQKESGYPLGLIKEFHSLEEYTVYRDAGLMKKIVDGKAALVRNIDINQKDAFGRTNLERMLSGEPAHDPTGISYELHHVGQKNDSVFAILTQAEHRGAGNFTKLHNELLNSPVDHGSVFEAAKKAFWKNLGQMFLEGMV